MIKGWKNNPERVNFYARRDKERVDRLCRTVARGYEAQILESQLEYFRKHGGLEDENKR